MLLEIHAHSSEHSACSRVAAAEIVRETQARNLQGVVLTDHHYRWNEAELAALRREAGVPDHFLLLAGQEVSTADCGHVLVFAAAATFAAGATTASIREAAPEAALVRAHPYRNRLDYRARELLCPGIDAIEVVSANHSMKANSRGLDDWHRHRFVATAGTDAHGQVPAGSYPTQFDHPVGGIEELAREIRLGRCRPFLKEIAHAGANSVVTEIVIGTKGPSGDRPRIVLRRFTGRGEWARARTAAALMGQISGRGFSTARYRLPELFAVDAARQVIIEEGVRGRLLFDRMRSAGAAEGGAYLGLASGWLARLHNMRLALTPSATFLEQERRRLEGYTARFAAAGHPRADLVRRLATAVGEEERRIVEERPGILTQCHGDYHPKNVFVGQDVPEDRRTLFAAAIDLDNAALAPRSFDVGWFLAHYRHQFEQEPGILRAHPARLFLEGYRREAEGLEEDFERLVAFFAARADLSIAAYLVKLGLGGSPVVERLLGAARAAILEPQGGGT
jgi:3',5'-nucleoside bisphosphate phosphatase